MSWDPAYLSQSSVNNKVCGIDETALIARKEEHRICLLNGLAKPAAWKVNLAAVALCLVVAEPVL